MDEILKTVAQFFKAEWSSEGFIEPSTNSGRLQHHDGRLLWEATYIRDLSYIWITARLPSGGEHILESHRRYSFAIVEQDACSDGGEFLILVPEGGTNLSNIAWFARQSNYIEFESYIGFPHTPESAERLERMKASKTQAT